MRTWGRQYSGILISWLSALLLCLITVVAQAQTVDDIPIVFPGDNVATQPSTNAGFGGPKSVGRQLEDDAARRMTISRNSKSHQPAGLNKKVSRGWAAAGQNILFCA